MRFDDRRTGTTFAKGRAGVVCVPEGTVFAAVGSHRFPLGGTPAAIPLKRALQDSRWRLHKDGSRGFGLSGNVNLRADAGFCGKRGVTLDIVPVITEFGLTGHDA